MKKLLNILMLSLVFFSISFANDKETKTQTHVVMLGTGTPVLLGDRAGQAILVVVDKNFYLFDSGPGYLRNLKSVANKNFMPKDVLFDNNSIYGALNKVFITHLDSDHVLGLPELLLRPWVLGKDKALKVVGPKGTKKMVDGILKAYSEDIDHRLYGTQPANENGYKANVMEISDNQIVHQDEKVIVKSFKVPHGSWPDGMSFGYRVETPDKVIVISGDTRFSEKLYPHFKGANILIHEVMSEAAIARMPEMWQKYMYHAHTSTKQLAKIANEIKPDLLILNHALFFGKTRKQLTDELEKDYKGKYILAEDMDIYE